MRDTVRSSPVNTVSQLAPLATGARPPEVKRQAVDALAAIGESAGQSQSYGVLNAAQTALERVEYDPTAGKEINDLAIFASS